MVENRTGNSIPLGKEISKPIDRSGDEDLTGYIF